MLYYLLQKLTVGDDAVWQALEVSQSLRLLAQKKRKKGNYPAAVKCHTQGHGQQERKGVVGDKTKIKRVSTWHLRLVSLYSVINQILCILMLLLMLLKYCVEKLGILHICYIDVTTTVTTANSV